MSKGFKGFLVGLVTLISILLAFWLGFSIKNRRNPIDEIKSWFTTEVEALEDSEEGSDVLIPEGEEPEIVVPAGE